MFLPIMLFSNSQNIPYKTGPKLRIPTKIYHMSCLPKHDISSFPTHIWQRIGWNFMQTYEMCRKSCPILQISVTCMKFKFSFSAIPIRCIYYSQCIAHYFHVLGVKGWHQLKYNLAIARSIFLLMTLKLLANYKEHSIQHYT